MRRVAITGIGIVSSIGSTAEEVTSSLRGARSGVRFAPSYAEFGFRCQVEAPPKLAGEPIAWEGMIDRRAARFLAPGMLLGDFNSQPRAAPHRAIARAITDARTLAPGRRGGATYSTKVPLFRIDHVFVTEGITVRALFAARSPLIRLASDHLPLVMDFDLH